MKKITQQWSLIRVVGTSLLTLSLLVGCSKSEVGQTIGVAPDQNAVTTSAELSDKEVDNLVRRSYQYVAMYNVIQKFALDPASASLFMDGFNKTVAATALVDHNMTSIARPNNDTLYQGAVLDLRLDPIIVEYPAIDSKYVVLETSGYAHYVDVPLASTKGNFNKPVKVLFYTDRTEAYQGQKINGVDRILKVDDDFLFVLLRAMPHQAEPARMERIVQALESIKVLTLPAVMS